MVVEADARGIARIEQAMGAQGLGRAAQPVLQHGRSGLGHADMEECLHHAPVAVWAAKGRGGAAEVNGAGALSLPPAVAFRRGEGLRASRGKAQVRKPGPNAGVFRSSGTTPALPMRLPSDTISARSPRLSLVRVIPLEHREKSRLEGGRKRAGNRLAISCRGVAPGGRIRPGRPPAPTRFPTLRGTPETPRAFSPGSAEWSRAGDARGKSGPGAVWSKTGPEHEG